MRWYMSTIRRVVSAVLVLHDTCDPSILIDDTYSIAIHRT